jgi:hypothetical protein
LINKEIALDTEFTDPRIEPEWVSIQPNISDNRHP